MGREVKRVPLDFDWPVGEVWQGYLMPDRLRGVDCECGGVGETPARRCVEQITHLLLMADDDRHAQAVGRPLHPWLVGVLDARPSDDIGALGEGLAGRSSDGRFGHDAIDRWAATSKIIEAAGLDPQTWGICPTCKGNGNVEAYPGQRAESEAWESTEPPTGEGWQLWETVSEGSPITPAFDSAEGLARHMVTARPWGYSGDFDNALRFVLAGWAPSMVGDASGVTSGAEWVGRATP